MRTSGGKDLQFMSLSDSVPDGDPSERLQKYDAGQVGGLI